jgi:hypothetical protein
MLALRGLSYTESLTGKRNWTYDTIDSIEEVMSPKYFHHANILFEVGDSMYINAPDGQGGPFPIVQAEEYRLAPSALLH